MTIKLRRSTAAIIIGVIGVLAGLAVGQVADAVSADQGATASYVSPVEKQIAHMDRTLTSISKKLGPSTSLSSISEELQKIRSNTYEVCESTEGSVHPWCKGAF